MSHTQKDLLVIAKKHADNPAVQCLLTEIQMGIARARADYQTVNLYLRSIEDMLNPAGLRDVQSDKDFAGRAANLHACLTSVNSSFGTLACVLEKLGETIEY